MSEPKTITIHLPPELVDMVAEALASGKYTSESDFICHALAMVQISATKSLNASHQLDKLYEQGIVSHSALQSRDPVAELARHDPKQWQDIL